MAQELGQAKVHVDVANNRVEASEAQAQLLLQEQEQRSALLISELRRALKTITDQGVATTRASAEMEAGAASQRASGDKTSYCPARTSMGDVHRKA